MFIIYEDIFRYMSGNSSRTPLGYVETEEEAKEICNKLDSNMREKKMSLIRLVGNHILLRF